MRLTTQHFWLLLFASLLFSSSLLAQADLSLSITQSVAAPRQYSLYSVTATLTNDGPNTATGVEVSIPKPNGVVYQGGNEFSASQGLLVTFGQGAGDWTVGTLASGNSATITVNYFLNVPNVPESYAEVNAANQSDPDSTPGNGNGTVNEDDEASTGGPIQPADLELLRLDIRNPILAAGIFLEYVLDIRNNGPADIPQPFSVKSYISIDNVLSPDDIQEGLISTGNFGAGYQRNNIEGASSTFFLAPGDYFLIVVADGDQIIIETNENNNTLVKPFTISGTMPTCLLTATVPTATCNDNGTGSNPADDRIDVLITIDNIIPGTPFTVQLAGQTVATGSAGTVLGFDGGLISAASGSTITYTVVDDNDSNCTTTFTIPVPNSCSTNTGSGDIDLSLSLSQNVTTPGRYTLYSVSATVSNQGPQAATGVVVDLPLPAGVVYEGGNEFSASQGSLATFGGDQGQWNVGSLGASQSATITVNYFRTGATPSDSYAEVLAANQTDSDSTPGNGNGQVNEDDEASTGTPTGPTCSFVATLLSVDCSDEGTPNDPSDDTYSIVVSAENPGSVAGSWQSSNYPVGAAYGQTIREEIGRISFYPSGQIIMTDAAEGSCRDTLNFTAPAPCSGGVVAGPCSTFEESATIDPLDQGSISDVNGVQTASGYELTSLNRSTFNSATRRNAVYSFDANGAQISPTPVVTGVVFTDNVSVDFQSAELIVTDISGNPITTVPFTNPIPAGSAGQYEGGFTARLTDGSGYLVFVRQVELNSTGPDVTTLYSFSIDNNYQQVGGVSTYPAMPTRYEGATFLAPSGQGGNSFLRIIERGTNSTYVLLDGTYARLGAVSLGVNGRFFQPFEFQELSDGTFTIVSYFDGAPRDRSLQIARYERNGTLINSYNSSASFFVNRDPFQAAVRQDGGFVGVSGLNASGSTIEVRNGNGVLLAESYLDGLFNIDLSGVTADTSILLLANRGSVNGDRVFVKLTRLGEQECTPVYDACDPPQTDPTSAIVSSTVTPGGIITIDHNLYGTPGTITIDGPARLGISIIDPSTFIVNSTENVRGRIVLTGTLRDNINPGNSQPFVIETDAQSRDLSSFIPTLQRSDVTRFDIIGSTDFATILVEYFTGGRSYGLAKIQSGRVLADELQVGDLVTNRVNGAVINEDDDVIYLSYRNGNSQSWPRLRVLSLTDISTIADVLLADAVTNSQSLVSGNTGYPNVLPNGDVAVAFSANDGTFLRYAAIVDAMGNIVSTIGLPSLPPSSFGEYVATGTTPNGDVRFSFGTTEVALLANGSLLSCSAGPTQGVDLELSATSSSNQPAIYDVNSITVTVTNTGTETATGATVDIPKPADVVYTGGNEFTTSQGSFATYGSDEGTWTVGDLAAGETATIVVNYFSLSATGYTQFVEVLSQNELDADSTPGNGSGTSASEDDEAYLDLTSSARAALTINFYPNPAPAGEQIVLKYVSSGETEVPLLVSDINGRIVHQASVQFTDGFNTVPVSIGNLPSGVYVLSLSDTGLQPTRLVVR
ncbi:MAG: CARDB domain-containing protein [Saprospiraceae bacterium]